MSDYSWLFGQKSEPDADKLHRAWQEWRLGRITTDEAATYCDMTPHAMFTAWRASNFDLLIHDVEKALVERLAAQPAILEARRRKRAEWRRNALRRRASYYHRQ